MDANVIQALIGACGTLLGAGIGVIAAREKGKANDDIKVALNKHNGTKPIMHYLLFWWHSEAEWAINDWNASTEYVAKFQPTVRVFKIGGVQYRDGNNHWSTGRC